MDTAMAIRVTTTTDDAMAAGNTSFETIKDLERIYTNIINVY